MPKIPYSLIAKIAKTIQEEIKLPENVIIQSMDISLRKEKPVKVKLEIDIFEKEIKVEE